MAEVRQVNEGIRYEPGGRLSLGLRPYPLLFRWRHRISSWLWCLRLWSFDQRARPGAYLPWAVFMALITCGFTSIIQAFRFGRIGAGHLILTGFNIPFIAISTLALQKGGPGLLASLMVVSTLVQIVLTAYLPLLRRIFTRTVSGTIVMLVAGTAAPFLFNDVVKSTQDLPVDRVIATMAISLLVGVLVILRAPQAWRLWIVGITILAGLILAVPLGLYDNSSVVEAAYIGFPRARMGGF